MPASCPDEIEQTIKRDDPAGTYARKSHLKDNETRDVPALSTPPENLTQSRAASGWNEVVHPSTTTSLIGELLPVVPGYILVSELARGGMGVVFVVRDKVLNREVAVKTLLPGSASNPTALRRFVTEARITARLSHPGIPPVYALGAFPDGRPFLAMKLIKGCTLRRASRGTDGSTGRR